MDPIKVKNEIVSWIREWFEKNGQGCKAVIGISGGKDSSVVAGLCAEALGSKQVFGVLMPNGTQKDIHDSLELCNHLNIDHSVIDIRYMMRSIVNEISMWHSLSQQAQINLPPRIRMTVLYAVSQSINGRVANTCNLSEDYVGYSTKYGDAAGDFAPLKSLTSDEVIEVGRALKLPEHLLIKPPADGLCGLTDEENLGFSYAVLNRYIRTGEIDNAETKAKIDHLHEINAFKEKLIERYEYKGD